LVPPGTASTTTIHAGVGDTSTTTTGDDEIVNCY
jgi:hypothetical protein